MNVEAFARHYDRSRCGFLTLTAGRDSWISPKEFGAAWDDIRKHALGWVRSYVRVLEPQLRGAPHYHLLVATPFDLLPDQFNWDALFGAAEARKTGNLAKARELTRQYADGAPAELRACWAELRRVCKRYGLGRSEFLPFRKGGGAVAEYVGKYLEKGLRIRRPEWKGSRRVEYDRSESGNWRACGLQFQWASPGARDWRRRVAQLGDAFGAWDESELRILLGPKWCFHLRGRIVTSTESEWQDYLARIRRSEGREDYPAAAPRGEEAASGADAKQADESACGT